MPFGTLAQLAEHCPVTAEVTGSSPVRPAHLKIHYV